MRDERKEELFPRVLGKLYLDDACGREHPKSPLAERNDTAPRRTGQWFIDVYVARITAALLSARKKSTWLTVLLGRSRAGTFTRPLCAVYSPRCPPLPPPLLFGYGVTRYYSWGKVSYYLITIQFRRVNSVGSRSVDQWDDYATRAVTTSSFTAKCRCTCASWV